MSAQQPEAAPPAPDVVVLDVGEVLVDETRVWTIWAQLLGVSPFTLHAVIGAAVVQGDPDAHLSALEHVSPNVDWTTLVDEHERRYGGFEESDLYADARPCLTELSELGVRVVIAGNQPARRGPQLRRLGLPAEAVLTSDELGADKPDPAFFARLLTQLAVEDPGHVLYVGDRVDNDVVPAADAGLRTCWLRRGPWGQLQDVPEDLEPDLVLDGLGELPTLLAAWRAGEGDDGER